MHNNDFLSNAELDRLKIDFPELKSGTCPTCHDRQFYLRGGERQVCPCPEQKRLYLRYLHAGIGLTFQRLTWDDLSFSELGPLADWVANSEAYIDRGIGLFISGPLGTGKTLILNLVLKDLIKRGVDCYATTFAETVEAFTATWGDAEEKRRFARRFKNSTVLGLDDLGKEFRNNNRLSPTTFDMILRTRVQNSRPTILTTNMTADELKWGYGNAVLSLLVEKSIEVILTGDDFRPQAQERSLAEVRDGETRLIT